MTPREAGVTICFQCADALKESPRLFQLTAQVALDPSL